MKRKNYLVLLCFIVIMCLAVGCGSSNSSRNNRSDRDVSAAFDEDDSAEKDDEDMEDADVDEIEEDSGIDSEIDQEDSNSETEETDEEVDITDDNASSEDAQEEIGTDETNESQPEEVQGEEESSDSNNGIRPEFKALMDNYEAFMDEYCEFMKNTENASDPAWLAEYTQLMAKYADFVQKIDDLGEEEMNDAEALYYAEVTLRVERKLLEAMQ